MRKVLLQRGVPLELHGMLHIGEKRAHQEDAWGWCDDRIVVADGVGGVTSGSAVAQLACAFVIGDVSLVEPWVDDAVRDAFETYQQAPPLAATLSGDLVARIEHANATIAALCEADAAPFHRGSGATVVALAVDGDNACVAHVGDARAYRLRDRQLTALTRDHTLVNEQIARGLITANDAAISRFRNIITRSLGYQVPMAVEYRAFSIAPGDVFLLCSDGIHGMISDANIETILSEAAVNVTSTCARLVATANLHGGNDNIAAVVARVE